MRLWARSAVVIQLCFILLAVPDIWAFFGLTARDPILTLTLNFHERMRDFQADRCNMLALHRKQKRLCRRGKGVAETLIRALRLSALECQHQFQHERWNCTLGNYRKTILEKSIKETSFLYAISSAGLVHEIARACAQGILDRCTCDESKHLKNKQTWLWGGCGDNLRYGRKFTRKFLRRAKHSEKDIRAKVDEHNSNAGIKIVKDLANYTCKCHGVSGSCTVKTCWLQLAPFKTVGNFLKAKYERSSKVISFPNQADGETRLMKQRHRFRLTSYPYDELDIVPLRRSDLTYIEDSPNFCRSSRYSPGTSGRSCQKGDNCDSICCGRGYNVQKMRVKRPCKCEVIWCCTVKCKECSMEEEIYLCK